MADEKYGRLFTEMDLKLVAAEAAVQMVRRINRLGPTAVYGTRPGRGQLERIIAEAIEREDADGVLTFPADEPLFLLRGQDLAAHGGVWGYAYEASRVGASIEFVTAVLAAANDLRDWAGQHRHRMKIPD